MRGIPRPYTVSLEKPYERPVEGDNRRRAGRFRVKKIHATRERQEAEVLDISATGMRIQMKGRLQVTTGELFSLTVRSDRCAVEVQAKVMWIKEIGRKDNEVGLDFHDLNPSDAAAIRTMAIDASRSVNRGS
ncbi:MAG: PilZ domain-containing protein [Phycisphaeraceae bacterium]